MYSHQVNSQCVESKKMDGSVVNLVTPAMSKAEERRLKKELQRLEDVRIMTAGAKRFAAFDRSDPFTFNRCQAHIRSGVASIKNLDDQKSYYDCDPYQSSREYQTENGAVKYSVTEYRNLVRP
jgi:hypothetical protein